MEWPDWGDAVIRGNGGHVSLRLDIFGGFWNLLLHVSPRPTGESHPQEEDRNFFLALASVLPGVIYQSRITRAGRARVEYLSEATRQMLESEAQDLLGDSGLFRSMIHPEDKERFRLSVNAQLGRSGTWQLDYRLNLPSGRVIWISSQASVVAEPDGTTVWRGFFTDITARKQVEQDLLAERERLALATHAGHIGTWDYDFRNPVIQWNDAMYEIHGVSPESYVPTTASYEQFYLPEDLDRMRAGLVNVVASGQARSQGEAAILRPDGERRLIRSYATVIRDLDEKPIRMVGITVDITADKEAEEMLVRAKEAAEAAARAKSEFLATMSHEIRTPMNGILGYTELLKSSELDPEQRQFLETIETSGEHLLTLINDILDTTQIETGKIAIRHEPFEVRPCVNQVVEMLRPVAKSKGLNYQWSSAPDLPVGMVSDPRRLAQILTNILGNALKFTSTGSVGLTVKAAKEDAENWCWEFLITDTGPGITGEAMQHIFEPFYQEDSSARRRHGGTGLGLSISRRLAGLLNGSITAENLPGGGSKFLLTLRAPALQMPTVGEVVPAPLRRLQGLRVLVVEDNAVNRRLCQLQLQRLGCRAEFAEDGRQMVAHFTAMEFDVLLVDMQLPHLDGCEATVQVRQIEAERGSTRTPIIALTANVLLEDRARCFDAGMDDYLSKPISQAKLEQMLSKWAVAESLGTNAAN